VELGDNTNLMIPMNKMWVFINLYYTVYLTPWPLIHKQTIPTERHCVHRYKHIYTYLLTKMSLS
jgi:hypothetical protein